MSADIKFTPFYPDAEDFVIYEERLDNHFAACGISDDKKKVAILLSCIGSETYTLLRSLCFPDAPKVKKFEELTALLTSHYQTKVSTWRERRKFYNVNQKDGETINDFYSRLRSSAINCNFGTSLTEILAHKFMAGLRNGKMLDRLCEEDGSADLKHLIELAMKVESSAKASLTSSSMDFQRDTVNMVFQNGRKTRNVNYHNANRDGQRNQGHASNARSYSQHLRTSNQSGGDAYQQQRRTSRGNSGMNFHGGEHDRYGSHGSAAVNNKRGHVGKNQNKISNFNSFSCKHCGSKSHRNDNCGFKNAKCNVCARVGHISRVCFKNRCNFVDFESSSENNHVNLSREKERYDDIFYYENREKGTNSNYVVDVYGMSGVMKANPFKINVCIDGKPIKIVIDSGAGLSALSKNTFLTYFSSLRLRRDETILRSYDGGSFRPDGYVTLDVLYQGVTKPIKFYVVPGATADILGRDWIETFDVRIELMNEITISDEVTNLFNAYPEVFTEKLGNYTHSIIKIKLKENAQPVFLKHRSVPFAYKNQVFKELDKLEKDGVIEPIDNSEWATPLVPVVKSDGSLRLCADYKVTVNKFLTDVKYPLPKVLEIFASLNKGEKFSKIDLRMAYMQFKVDSESSKILTWNTERGLYRVNKMPFGLTCCTSIFQREMEILFKNMNFVAVFVDDIVVSGEDTKQHLENLRKVLDKLKQAGLTVKKDKCVFFQDQIDYLGFTLTKEGLKKTKDKVKAIVGAPSPKNLTEVRSFIGAVMYYNRFIPNAAEILTPIYQLLKANQRFVWSANCQKAFTKIKGIIASDSCIVHFDPNLPIIVTADASDNGIAGTLSHIIDGVERTVTCVSRTLQPCEQKMSTVMKEALAIYYTINKLYFYLCNTKFTLRSDHKPLVTIFGEHKGIPQMSANKLTRWAVFLSAFDYRFEHIKGTDNVIADYMSRAPIPTEVISEETAAGSSYIYLTEADSRWPIDNEAVRQATKSDPELSKVVRYVLEDRWPDKVSEKLKPFYHRRSELYIDRDILMWGHRICIPSVLKKEILNLLHASHPGIVRCKSLARSIVFWPGIDSDIERLTRACIPCLKTQKDPPKITENKWPETSEVMERIHIDFCHLENNEFLIITDSYSKWLEIFHMEKTTAPKTMEKLREVFARFGLPKIVVSDNGPPFPSKLMEEFFQKNGIEHVLTPPYHPMSNGAAENAVGHFKTKLKASLADPRNNQVSLNTLVSRFLLNHRNTPHTVTGASPAQIMFNRSLRTRLTLLKDRPMQRKPFDLENNLKNRNKYREFRPGDAIIVRDYTVPNTKQWREAKIDKRIGKTTYLCLVGMGKRWKRHLNQIRPRLIKENMNHGNNENEDNYSYVRIDKNSSQSRSTSPGTTGVNAGAPTLTAQQNQHGLKSVNSHNNSFSSSLTDGALQEHGNGSVSDFFRDSLNSHSNSFLSAGSDSPVAPTISSSDETMSSQTQTPFIRRSNRAKKLPTHLADYQLEVDKELDQNQN